MEFYCINFNSRRTDLFVEPNEDYDEHGLITGKVRPDETLQLKKSRGKYISDIVRLQDPFNFVISDNSLKKFQGNKLTGWLTFPVQIVGLINTFYGFQVVGKSGPPVRPKDSGFVKGFNFDISKWDGSDFFIPDSTLKIVCTETAKNVLEELNIRNLEIENTEKMEWYNA